MFNDIWDQRLLQGSTHIKALKAQIADAERKTEKLLDKIVATDDPVLCARLEEKFSAEALSKTVLKEKLSKAGQPAHPFEEALEHAMSFVATPWKMWEKAPTRPAEPSSNWFSQARSNTTEKQDLEHRKYHFRSKP